MLQRLQLHDPAACTGTFNPAAAQLKPPNAGDGEGATGLGGVTGAAVASTIFSGLDCLGIDEEDFDVVAVGRKFELDASLAPLMVVFPLDTAVLFGTPFCDAAASLVWRKVCLKE